MVGDLKDFISRLRAVLPKRWFPDHSPNLDALLTAIATSWVWLYNLVTYVSNQTRLITATDGSLDLISADYFGRDCIRKDNESDVSFRSRIQAALLREAATRTAVIAGLQDLTGTSPVIFEPGNCADTGSYGKSTGNTNIPSTGMAYGQMGGWGSLSLPLQFFVTATRPATPWISMVAGYGTSAGGYGTGAISYVDLSLLQGEVSDADVQLTLCRLLPINATAWLRII